MKRISTCIVLALFLAAGLTALAADPPAKPATKEQIAEWVKGLGSDSFEEREKASKALWKAGQAAEPALRQVLKDGDAEAVRRAREILDKFDAGLYPDTPEAVTRLIDEYRSGTPEARAAAIPKLLDQGGPGYAALMRLAAQEKDGMAKALIWQLLAADMPRLAAALLADGQDARLQEILEQGLSGEGDAPITNYAAYLLVRGKLDDKLRDLQKKAGANPDKHTALTLAYLCRANGDLAGARRYAEKADNANLFRTILIEQEDWRALLKQLDSAPAAAPPGFLAPPVEKPNGLRLACLRLAGDRDGFEALLRKLPNEPAGGVDLSAFLLNGRPDEGLGWLAKQNDPAAAAELLGARGRYRDALDAADRPAPADKLVSPWAGGLFKAGLLARLGERKKAREIFDKVVADTKPEQNNRALQTVMIAEYNAGMAEEAFTRAAALLEKAEDKSDLGIVNWLFQPATTDPGVTPWWKFLRRKYPKDDVAATLKRLRDFLGRKVPAADVTALCKAMADDAAGLKPEERSPALHALAEACRTLSRDDLEENYLQKWAAAGGGSTAWLRLGDLSAEKKRWKEAAERYKTAWQKDRSAALPLYLHGHALVQAGEEKEGRRWMEVAQVLPLGSDEKRVALAAGLDERGFDTAAAQEWERLRRLTDFATDFGIAARSLAEKALYAKDYLKAATYFRREGLHYLLGQYVEDVEGHLWLAIAEHRCRACAFAVAGRLDDMNKEVEAVLTMQPGNIELGIDLVNELTKRGKKKEADALFARIYAVQDGLCKEYPKSGWSHNNTAWLAVRCRRDLDAALAHARQGVELEPDNSGHLDTLAEVHFQRGDKVKAIELMKKCIAMPATLRLLPPAAEADASRRPRHRRAAGANAGVIRAVAGGRSVSFAVDRPWP